MRSQDPALHLLAGPNGAGKSTYVERVLTPWIEAGMPFINADLIAAERWPHAQAEHAYDAAAAAAAERNRLISERRSFITETVFSHPSKLALVRQARSADYHVYLHVIMVPVELSLARVRWRAALGGHDVPEQKVRERYERLWDLVAAARAECEVVVVYDNSDARTPFRFVAEYDGGVCVAEAGWPHWAPKALRG